MLTQKDAALIAQKICGWTWDGSGWVKEEGRINAAWRPDISWPAAAQCFSALMKQEVSVYLDGVECILASRRYGKHEAAGDTALEAFGICLLALAKEM
jgi:hypothetical protein